MSARQLGPVVGEAGGDLETHAAVLFDEIEHCRPGSDKRFDQGVVHRVQGLCAQVAQRIVDREVPVGGSLMGGDPSDPARDGGGLADGRRLLEHRHRGAGDCRAQGCRESGAAAAEHDDIECLTPQYDWVSLQLSCVDSCRAASMTAPFARITTSSRCEMRLMQVGGAGAGRLTGTASP